MPPDLADRIAQVQALFPEERLRNSRERLRRLWAGEPPLDRLPFVASPIRVDYYAPNRDPAAVLDAQLDEWLIRGRIDDDFIPAFFPGCRQATIPGMFGAEELWVGEAAAARRILTSIADIAGLKTPTIAPGTVAQDWLDMQAWLVEATAGAFPIHVTDMQGPADLAGQLLGYEDLLLSAFEDPTAYDRLMSACSEAFIAFWRAQADLLGPRFVGTHLWGWNWVPPDVGASLSADSLVMISPDFYRRFHQPYLERIAAAFGGLSIHSCGRFDALVPALMQTPGLRAINASQMSPRQLAEAGLDGRVVLIAGASTTHLADLAELVLGRGLRIDLTIWDLWPNAAPATWSAADWRLIHQRVAQVHDTLRHLAPATAPGALAHAPST